MIGTKDEPGTLEFYKKELNAIEAIPKKLSELHTERVQITSAIYNEITNIADIYRQLYHPITEFLSEFNQESESMPISFAADIVDSGLSDYMWALINRQVRGSFSGVEESELRLKSLLRSTDFNKESEALEFVEEVNRQLHSDTREGVTDTQIQPDSQLRKGKTLQELYDVIFGLRYLKSSYFLKFGEKSLEQLSPGERGLLLLIFYLLVDKSDLPLIVDQPEENLDNQTIYETLVRAVTSAVKRRQVIVATHSANVAVVCDADQIISVARDQKTDIVTYTCGSLEEPPINSIVVDVLEGTKFAFNNRRDKYLNQ